MDPSNWRFLRSQPVRDFRIIKFREDIYQFAPTGVEQSFAVCDTPDWVLVIPLTPDDEVVFVRQFRHGRGEMVLEIPGGIIDLGERPEQTAARELREETGYVAERMELFGPLLPNPALNTARFHIALALGCVPKFDPEPEPFEDIRVERRPLSSVSQMISSGELQHALCIASFTVSGVLSRHG